MTGPKIGGRSSHLPGRASLQNACFILLSILWLIIFWKPLSTLVSSSLQNASYSHIILVPLVSAFLIYVDRQRIFAKAQYSFERGSSLLVLGMALCWFGKKSSALLSENDSLSLAILSMLLLCVGGFVLCYGTQALRAAMFPLTFLLLMIPIPEFVLNPAILYLQRGSAEVAYAMFRLVGAPVFREGLFFTLPGVKIEVARECSGIRSSITLFITSLLASHLFLRSAWKKSVMLLSILPLLIFKNGLRIVTLSLLAIYVNRSFLTGNLHRNGGILFFVLALLILAPILRWLQKSESKPSARKVKSAQAQLDQVTGSRGTRPG